MNYTRTIIQTAMLIGAVMSWIDMVTCGSSFDIRAPCVFPPDDIEMHKYAAVLAATEPSRNLCSKQINAAIGPLPRVTTFFKGKSIISEAAAMRNDNEEVDKAFSRYEMRVENILRSYGMSPQEFNRISQQLGGKTELRRRTLLQAHYYKIAADLESNLHQPAMPFLSTGEGQLRWTEPWPVAAAGEVTTPATFSAKIKRAAADFLRLTPLQTVGSQRSALQRYSVAIRHIENERIRYLETLKRELKVDELPTRMADPRLRPAMCPAIQRACQEFSTHAQDIISKVGLSEEEFNALQRKQQRDVVFRWGVQRELRRVSHLTSDAAAAQENAGWRPRIPLPGMFKREAPTAAGVEGANLNVAQFGAEPKSGTIAESSSSSTPISNVDTGGAATSTTA